MKVYTLSHAMVSTTVILLTGLGLWWLYGQIGETRHGLDDQFKTFKSETNRKMQELPKPTEELREIVGGMEEKLKDMNDSFALLEREVDRQGVSDAITLADTAGLFFRGEKIRKRLQVLSDEFAEWTTRPDLLLTNDDGKRIAALPELVDRFMTSCEAPCTTEMDLASYEAQLERILTPVTRAYENEHAGFEIDESWAANLDELEKSIDEIFKRFDDQRIAIFSILKHTSEQIPDGTPTLKEAIHAERERREDEKAKLIEDFLREERVKNAQTIADAKAEADRLVAEAQAKAEQALGEQTARKIMEAVEEMARRERDTIRQRQEELARQQLEQDFDRDKRQIQTYLGALTLPGYRQPGRRGEYKTSTEKGPVSLSALRAAGALEQDIHGLAALCLAVERLDRAHSGWPRLKVSGDQLVQAGIGIVPVGPDQEFVQRAQDLLNKYGELMVKKEMLAP